MYDGTIQIRTRGGKRCAPNCTLFDKEHCLAGLDAQPGVVSDDCPKDGDYMLVRADKVAGEGAVVRSDIKAGEGDA